MHEPPGPSRLQVAYVAPPAPHAVVPLQTVDVHAVARLACAAEQSEQLAHANVPPAVVV